METASNPEEGFLHKNVKLASAAVALLFSLAAMAEDQVRLGNLRLSTKAEFQAPVRL